MGLQLAGWRQSPWGRATAGQWRYALRNTLAMCLALWIAFALNLDEPYWAFTSAAVVSFPTIGGVISKSRAHRRQPVGRRRGDGDRRPMLE